MSAGQGEIAETMVERCRSPAIGGVTLAAVEPEAALVGLIVMMTRVAILQGHGEIPEAARIDMALDTGKTHMFAGELERKDIVIEVLTQAIHAIMTVETGRAKGERVRGHERQIHLTVASITGLRDEGPDIAVMAIVAGERFARSRTLVTVQRESDGLVWERGIVHQGQRCVCPAVFRVAMTAAQPRIVVHQSPVHGRNVAHLLRDVHMAGSTAVRHGRGVPRRDVTGFTVPTRICMRRHAAQCPVPKRAQRSWIKN